MTGFVARQERFAVVGSTNDVVRGWLEDGIPEVCVAVAEEQTAGRGREGRSWVAPAGGALLVSLGFRPTWLAPDQVWRLAAIVSLAMAAAAQETAGLADRAIRLKWPNDLVGETSDDRGGVRKLAGVLGETDGLGGVDPRAIIGLGLNTDWEASAFPRELAASMTSLRELSDGRAIDHAALLEAFLGGLEARTDALRDGRFDVEEWAGRQITTGRVVELVAPDGGAARVRAIGVDGSTGALIVEDPAAETGTRQVLVGEIRHARLPLPATGASTPPATAGV